MDCHRAPKVRGYTSPGQRPISANLSLAGQKDGGRIQRLSAIVPPVLSRWTVTEHRRCGLYQPRPTAWVFVSQDNTRAESPIHSLELEKWFGLSALENPLLPSTQAVGLGWYNPAPSVLCATQIVPSRSTNQTSRDGWARLLRSNHD